MHSILEENIQQSALTVCFFTDPTSAEDPVKVKPPDIEIQVKNRT